MKSFVELGGEVAELIGSGGEEEKKYGLERKNCGAEAEVVKPTGGALGSGALGPEGRSTTPESDSDQEDRPTQANSQNRVPIDGVSS